MRLARVPSLHLDSVSPAFRLAGGAFLFSLMRKVSKRIKTIRNSLNAQTSNRQMVHLVKVFAS